MLTVITGPPCSGKTTELHRRANQLRAEGSEPLLVDFDALAVALGSPGRDGQGHGHPDHIVPIVQYARGVIIRQAVQAATRDGIDVVIVDSSPNQRRRDLYAEHHADLVLMDTPLDECHRRADAAGRPSEWHDLIDTWAPQQEDAGWAWDTTPKPAWHKRPAYRKGAAGRRYSTMRTHFLRDRTHCENCGQPFIRNAACQHKACLRHGRGCHAHLRYPTVEHTVALADGGPSLDVATWRAYCLGCNTRGGAAVRQRRRAAGQGQGRSLDLDW